MIFIGALLFILGFGARLVFFSSLVACFGLRCWDRVLCCQLKLDLYPADSRQWQRGTLGSPSAHWRSSVTGLDSKIRQEDGGARGSVGWVAGFDCCYFCCFPGEGFYFSSFFFCWVVFVLFLF